MAAFFSIKCNDGDRAAKIIQNALGIESDDVVKLAGGSRGARPYHRRTGCRPRALAGLRSMLGTV